jgi:hypothetical protein
MQFLIPGWTFDLKRPCLVRRGAGQESIISAVVMDSGFAQERAPE